MDAISQRIGALIFTALTRIDVDLRPEPDLAERWDSSPDGKTWRFEIKDGVTDHDGAPITADLMARCLEQYLRGTPSSAHARAFPGWKKARAQGSNVIVELEGPDPYFDKNVSLLRYFRVADAPEAEPCSEPAHGARVVTSGLMRPENWDPAPEHELKLIPVSERTRPTRFLFVRDESTRTLMLLRGEADLAQNTISLTKTRWIQKDFQDRFLVIERQGTNVTYLAFNLKDPILKDQRVRQAISASIDRASIIQHKFFGLASPAGRFLSPLIPESFQSEFHYDPGVAESLLDEAGYPRNEQGIRFALKLKSTPYRENVETTLIFRRMLAKVGIEVVPEPVEPAVFFSSIRNGAFQLYTSRWVGASDSSIYFRTLKTGQPVNRVSYSNPRMDRLLDRSLTVRDPVERRKLLVEIQSLMGEELPYLPLWYWTNALIIRKEFAAQYAGRKISLSGGFEPLVYR